MSKKKKKSHRWTDPTATKREDGAVAIGATSHVSTASTTSTKYSQNSVLFGMMLWDLLSLELSPITQWRQVLGIPMNEEITWPVPMTQLCLLLGWVLLIHQVALIHVTLQLGLSMCRRHTKRRTRHHSYSNISSGFVTMSSTEHTVTSPRPDGLLGPFGMAKADGIHGHRCGSPLSSDGECPGIAVEHGLP
jgi:hypothetical protein